METKVIVFLVAVGLTYAIIAFSTTELNPLEWHWLNILMFVLADIYYFCVMFEEDLD